MVRGFALIGCLSFAGASLEDTRDESVHSESLSSFARLDTILLRTPTLVDFAGLGGRAGRLVMLAACISLKIC
uniref:Putative secreted peptide n=1 Tax=Anopheles braziliensis TaxID=58242 RepID=A0A2M3ZQM2_9DIPT